MINYSLLLKYKALYEKYSSGAQTISNSFNIPKVQTQEEAVAWSLKLIEYFKTKAAELGVNNYELLKKFKSGAACFVSNNFPNVTRTEYGIACIYTSTRGRIQDNLSAAKQDIDKFGLYFDFNNIDDLFLSDQEDELGVIYL